MRKTKKRGLARKLGRLVGKTTLGLAKTPFEILGGLVDSITEDKAIKMATSKAKSFLREDEVEVMDVEETRENPESK